MATEAMKKQWRDLKAKHPDALLLFRGGDFYETYGEDAKVCARELGITLTFGNNDKRREWPMAGFPYHALDTYLPKLIRNGHRCAICDQLDAPRLRKTVKRGITETINNSTNQISEDEVMKNNTMKADLTVGTVIEIAGTTSKYIIKAIEADKLTVDFYRKEGEAPTTMPMPKAMLDKMMEAGKWKVAAETKAEEPNASEDVEEVEDVQPTAKEVKLKRKVTLKKKQGENPTNSGVGEPTNSGQGKPTNSEPKKPTKSGGRLTYSTYQNKAGKTCAKINGFAEGDAMLERSNAESIHASSTYERDKKGGKHYMLIFGPRYAAAAKEVCQALNAGKTLDDCKAIIDAATEERQQKREAWKQKQSGGYSDQQVADMIVEFLKGGTLPEGVMKRIPQEVIDMAA